MKRKKRTPEERAAYEARYQETMRMLRERIAYYDAKIAEKRAGGAASEQQ